MSFQDYLNNRQAAFGAMSENLKKEINTESRSGNKDERLWKPVMGKDNTGYAVVRFLPGTNVQKTPWVRVYSHGFQGPTGKWYIENSLTTINQQDPVSEYNSKLWNSGIESNKDLARKQKRRTSYYANVMVIKDPANPSNEGKVMIYQFGQKIFDKLTAAMQPEFADEEAINPFDIIEGANFRIKIKIVSGYWNYDSSEFEKASPLSDDQEKLEAVFNAQHDVHEMVDPSSFKSYNELQEKLMMVVGENVGQPQYENTSNNVSVPTAETTNTKEEFGAVFEKPTDTTTSSTDEDDLEDYFKSLAAD
jgi:hypothetical protein